jgi:competence protein ComEA
LAGAELGSVWGQYRLTDVERRASFTAPAAGRWHIALLLREWTLENGYVTRDYRSFDATYEQAAAEPAATVAPQPNAATQAAEKLRLIQPATRENAATTAAPAPAAAKAPAPAAPTATASARAPASPAAPVTSSRLVSIQTGSLDELSRLPGLSLKIAKEIVKNRPYASVDALVGVRGVGDKTLRRIKSLITL